jgi:hypothetical protein
MTHHPVTIIGSYLSPYVRKVLACLAIKGVPYRIDPIVPFFGNDELSRLSPVRRAVLDRRVPVASQGIGIMGTWRPQPRSHRSP